MRQGEKNVTKNPKIEFKTKKSKNQNMAKSKNYAIKILYYTALYCDGNVNVRTYLPVDGVYGVGDFDTGVSGEYTYPRLPPISPFSLSSL